MIKLADKKLNSALFLPSKIPSVSMLLLAIAFVGGAWTLQQLAQLPSMLWLCAALLLSFIVLFQYVCRQEKLVHFKFLHCLLIYTAIFLLGVSFAALRASLRLQDDLPHVWEQKTILIEGVIASVPETSERGVRFKFDVERIRTPQAIVPRHISLNYYNDVYAHAAKKGAVKSTKIEPQFHAGARWQLVVRLKRPHGTLNPHGFDFESWALSENMRATGAIKAKAGLKKISPLVWQPAYLLERWREVIKDHIARVLKNQPYLGVIQALVMGDDSQISVATWQVFLTTGTTHLMSISGLHITMLAGLALLLTQAIWRRMPLLILALPARKAATLAGVLVACLYALVAGFSVPTQRTFYMLMVFALALWSGRQWRMSQVLAAALIVVVLLDPWAVNAAGFWLSFGAVAIISYALSGRIGQIHWFKTALITQWAVTIGMLPMLLVLFNQASIISPFANAIAIPVISFMVTPLALLGSFLPIDIFLIAANVILNGLMHVLNALDALPLAMWHQHAPPLWTLLPATVGVLILLLPNGIPLRYLGLAGFIPLLMITPQKPLLGEMKVTVLDVGQGLSVVIQTAKHTLLYDAGPKFNTESDAGSRIVLPYLYAEGVKQLDGMIISHDDIDHSGGMASILQVLPPAWLLSSFAPEVLPAQTFPKTIKKISCQRGQMWLWDQVKFEILYPSQTSLEDPLLKDNNKSCVLKITSLAGRLLLTGDIEKAAENILLAENTTSLNALKSDVLIVPHHGSKTSSQPGFIDAVSPQVSLFTVGYLNRFGHPKPVVMKRYLDRENKIYRSDEDGGITLSFVKNAPHNPIIQVQAWRAHYKRYWLNSLDKKQAATLQEK